MANFGIPELLIIVALAFSAAIPIVTFVFVLLTYSKVKALEQRVFSASPELAPHPTPHP